MTKVKKKNMFKLFALVLAVMMVLPMFVACNKEEPQKPAEEEKDIITGDYLYLGERGYTDFSVVYSAEAWNLTKVECKNLVDQLLLETEAELTVVEDASQVTKREIIVGVIGTIGREDIEKEVAKYNLGKYDYLIKVMDNDIIIALGDRTISEQAFLFFRNRLMKIDKANQAAYIRKDLEYVYRSDDVDLKNGLKTVKVTEMNPTDLRFTLNPASEYDVFARLTYTGNGGWRIQTKYNMAEEFSVGAAQDLAIDLGEAPTDLPQQLTYWDEGDNLIAQAPDGSYVVLNKASFSIKFCDANGKLTRTLSAMNHGYIKTGKIKTLSVYAKFTLDDTEAIYGTGERFDGANQRGKVVDVHSGAIADALENSNVAVPLFTSSRGSGIFVNNNAYLKADIGGSKYNELALELDAGPLDVYVFTTSKITDVLNAYASISGYAKQPENWMNGLLVCRYDENANTLDAVKAIIATMQVYGTPWTGIVLDGWNLHDFDKHADLKEICDLVHGLGKKIICNVDIGFIPTGIPATAPKELYDVEVDDFYLSWTFEYQWTKPEANGGFTTGGPKKVTIKEIPIVRQAGGLNGAPIFVSEPTGTLAKANPFLVAVETGDRNDTSDDVYYQTKTYLDITNPEAVEWFFTEYWTYLVEEIGFDGAKIDDANLLPDMHGTLNFYDKNVVTEGARAWYTTYFTALLNKTLVDKIDGGVCYTTGGGIGSQRNAFILGGEQSRTTNRLERQVSGLLSAGLSGLPFVTYYAGGSFYKNDNELSLEQESKIFLRGVQFATFTASLLTDDANVRGAFDFAAEDEEYAYVSELYALYAKLHDALNPYLSEVSAEAAVNGMPMARHLVLMWQNDTKVYDIDDQYMLGDAFLVAPELYGAGSREVYLPEGKWIDLNTGEEIVVGAEGKTVTCNVTIAQIPLFYNANTTSKTAASVLDDVAVYLDAISAIELP